MDEQREARILANRKRRKDAKDALDPKDGRADEEKIQDENVELAEDIPDLRPEKKKPKSWHLRPPNWEDIAQRPMAMN